MMFRIAIIVVFIASTVTAWNDITPNGEIDANSNLGLRLLSQADVITPPDAAFLPWNDNKHQRKQQERDFTYVANYSLRYLGCHSSTQVAAGARFALCPTVGDCNTCEGGGEYVLDMESFVDAFTEAMLTEQEYACEMVRESCDCENANDDEVCEASCYEAAGLPNCINDDSQVEFEVQRYLKCNEIPGGNNNNNGIAYYIGPYCSADDKYSIHLGVFTDEDCTALTDPSIYTTITGEELPFTSNSLISSECHSCLMANNNNDNFPYYEPSESCMDLYEDAIKCEVNMDISSKDENGCDYINNILPKLASPPTNKPISCGIFGLALFCPMSFCGFIGRLLGLCDQQ